MNFSFILMLGLTLSTAPAFAIKKAFDDNAVYCQNNMRDYDKVLKMKMIELNLSEDSAEMDVEVSLVEDACEDSHLDVAPSTAGSLQIKKYTLTATLPDGRLLYSTDLDELISKSKEKVTIGLPKNIVLDKKQIEIGIQVQGIDSQTIELLNPVEKNFGVFIHQF